MYNTDSVSSGLITGTQWDVMLKKIVEKTDLTEAEIINPIKWGNYRNNSIEYKGRKAKAYISSSNIWHLEPFGGETEGKTSSYSSVNSQNGELLTTGASRQTEKYHIFDVSGNLWEWTDEVALYKANTANETNNQYRVPRNRSIYATGLYLFCMLSKIKFNYYNTYGGRFSCNTIH